MDVKYTSCILVFIWCCHCGVFGLDFRGINYCDFSNSGTCSNKTHLLCNVEHRKKQINEQDFKVAVLSTLNTFRTTLRIAQGICNLPNFEWSEILQSLAEGAVFRENFENYCLDNAAHKYILNFNLTNINSNADIPTQINNIINSNEKPGWLYSAYTTKIGCALNNTHKYIICMVNGIEVIYSDQSYGYKNECIEERATLPSTNCSYDSEKFICENHVICDPSRNFNNSHYQKMSFSTKKFILHKLMSHDKNIKWNYDLEYLAEQIVTQNVSLNDKCLVINHFPNVTAFHFEGTDRYNELNSNIDDILYTNNITQNVGCVIYTQTTEQEKWNRIQSQWNTHIYCLSDESVPDYMIVTETSWWPMLVVALSVIAIMCVSLGVYGTKIRKKSNVNNDECGKECETKEIDSSPSNYYDIIDVR